MQTPTQDSNDIDIDSTDGSIEYEHLRDALAPGIWETVGRRLLAKMLAEFGYEELVVPRRTEDGYFHLGLSDGVEYRFEADDRLFDWRSVHPDSIERRESGDWEPATDPVRFLLDAQGTIGVSDMTAGHLIREYRNTMLADAHIEAKSRDGERDLTALDYAELEGEMTGHPWITYNKGRLGFGYDDYLDYAPERKQPVTLSWLGVSRERATFSAVSGLDHQSLVADELGDLYGAFRAKLEAKGLDPDDYYFLPVHEWQWDNSVVQLFADEIATNAIVPLGDGPDEYLPQQSIRTFVNVDELERHHVKLPLRILNTLVYRGLPGERTEVAPIVTEYIEGIYEDDEFLREECDLILPGEIAGLNYDHPDFSQLDGSAYQYDELLGCVWRESIYTFLDEDENAITLSSLMHVEDGTPYLESLVEESGLSMEAWLDELFETVLPPLLHYLYRYGTVFSPHGQNTMLVLKDGRPHRLAVKDFVDDVNVSDQPLPELQSLPGELRAVLRTEPPEGLCQFIFSGLFVCVFRYVADALETHSDYSEERFWLGVREAVEEYQAEFPELEDRFELFDLLRPEFTKLCLNRNRLLDYGYEDADGRPHASEHGTVPNPLYEVVDR
ncbi:iron transport protein C [Haladaptatus paucihalophilus DX253]|uniref:Iron transport protein C n=1 Tax=Haladaptatus paucihalophilus DX253 TaxID=797209 RepID=E7QXC3_HALPU|nr:IucA/IucC family siderophore biosynthesis protein [Haladaptatus paucihalophilus]EFW90926.1 iron transport protein C [Haladaptatus paucihalophilus DX253]SHK26307.1 Siderophore synthetase component [Haladaptatus paucihalophilus DX253]